MKNYVKLLVSLSLFSLCTINIGTTVASEIKTHRLVSLLKKKNKTPKDLKAIGLLYLDENVNIKNSNKGVTYLEAAAEKGSSKAISILSRGFYYGYKGIEINKNKAFNYIKKGMELTKGEKPYDMYTIYLLDNKNKDEELIKNNLSIAISKGINKDWLFARMYSLGVGIDVNVQKAHHHYLEGLKQNSYLETEFIEFIRGAYGPIIKGVKLFSSDREKIKVKFSEDNIAVIPLSINYIDAYKFESDKDNISMLSLAYDGSNTAIQIDVLFNKNLHDNFIKKLNIKHNKSNKIINKNEVFYIYESLTIQLKVVKNKSLIRYQLTPEATSLYQTYGVKNDTNHAKSEF